MGTRVFVVFVFECAKKLFFFAVSTKLQPIFSGYFITVRYKHSHEIMFRGIFLREINENSLLRCMVWRSSIYADVQPYDEIKRRKGGEGIGEKRRGDGMVGQFTTFFFNTFWV